MNLFLTGLFPLICAFTVVSIVGTSFIPWLAKLKFGQEIREEGPVWHQKKSGTPTMGGLMFILGISIAVVLTFFINLLSSAETGSLTTSLLVLFVAVGFGAVGFIDDYIKVVKKRNLGLKALPKFIMQIAITVIYIMLLKLTGGLACNVVIPFVGITFALPLWLYVIFVVFVVTGTVNAVNLTDGLDGLATSVTIPVVLFFALCGYRAMNMGLFTFGIAVVGGLIGFLIYNKYPAKVFMGDTGSLFLGGAVVAMAIALQMHFYLVIAGFIYFVEALSVILQVACFKLTGKRIFKMSPIHHHFEKCDWSENKIVYTFTAITIIMCIISYFV